MTLTPLKTLERSLLKPGLLEMLCYHILHTFFFFADWGAIESIWQSQMSVAHQDTYPSYLHLAAQISFYEEGLPFPASSHKVITSCSPCKTTSLPILSSQSKTLESRTLMCQEKKHLDDGSPHLWTHSHNYSRLHHSPATLEAERQHQCQLSATHLLATHPALLPFSFPPFL